MKPKTRIALATLLLIAALPAGAQELLGSERFELTPFFGYRIGGHFNGFTEAIEYPFAGATSWGGLVDINLNRNNYKFELLWSHQDTGLDRVFEGESRKPLQIDHFQAGIMQEVGNERARLAVAALAGGTRFASPGLGSETRFSGSIGGVAKVFVTPHVGLRLDARAYGVFVKGVTGAFCVNGTCAFAYTGNMLGQGDFTAGLIFAF
ncbi:MAG TPA: hypothetical protein PKU70_11580 [Vicinamibacteria bacterium]|nr:hypothetical protein [Vicinamibacteria bacterium]